MRITNKVMQNNALTNINRNKRLQDTLNTQLATGKKINRPSEDPVVAIRALRLRSDVNQVSQYYKKNVPDAEAWLNLTESSIKTTVSVVTDMIEQCEKGSNDTLTTEDRKIIIDSLKELRNEVYATGDADYAGRYIFTGYRTDTSLTFQENTTKEYKITEIFNRDDLEQQSYIETADLLSLSESNYENGGNAVVTEQDIKENTYYRLRLSYDNLAAIDNASITVGGTAYNIDASITDKKAAYAAAADPANANKIFYVKSTGELLMGADVYDAMKRTDESFQVTYAKESWLEGELRPEHYFYCETEDVANGGTIQYNPDYLTGESIAQDIEYQVGFNQFIQVNTYPEEIFQHDVGRDVDEIIDLANYLTDAEEMKAKLEAMSEDTVNYTEDQRTLIKKDLAAADKAVTYLSDQLQKKFSNYITHMQSYLDATNEALTLVGNRSARLELVSNRLADQTTTFQTLQSENEDADATEVAVQLSSAKISYEATLMATSDMIQQTLLNYL